MTKALEELERIKNIPILSTPESTQKIFYDKHKEELDLIETALKRSETLEEDFMSLTETNMELVQKLLRDRKKLKALEIINKKRVNIVELLDFSNSVDEYNEFAKSCLSLKVKQLNQEEFDLLKEVLL